MIAKIINALHKNVTFLTTYLGKSRVIFRTTLLDMLSLQPVGQDLLTVKKSEKMFLYN